VPDTVTFYSAPLPLMARESYLTPGSPQGLARIAEEERAARVRRGLQQEFPILGFWMDVLLKAYFYRRYSRSTT
jgi:hypothetical protein